MDGGFQYIDIIVIALIAIFILLRLRGSLGNTEGHIPEQTRSNEPGTHSGSDRDVTTDKVIDLNSDSEETGDTGGLDIPGDTFIPGPAYDALREIKKLDQTFSVAGFIDGAQWAHGEISMAFASGNRNALKTLLSPDLYKSFDEAISHRESNEETLERKLVRLHSSDILEASLTDRMAEITVKFVSDQIDTVLDSEGTPIECEENGDQREIIDIWVFSRNIRSSDPVWMLIETQADDA